MSKHFSAAPGKFVRRLALTAALGLASAASWAVEPFSAEYQASYMGMQGDGKMTLQAAGPGRWRYSLDVTGMGARLSQSTTFEEHDGRWRPVSSTDSQAGESGLAAMLIKKRTVEATYDWDKGEARWSGDVEEDEAGPVPLRPGDMDGMLMNLAVVRDVAAGKPLEYRLVEDGRAREQNFRVEGKETVTVGGRSHEATKVVRESGSRRITAWIVEGMPVPARILQQRRGRDHIDLQLQSIR
ncbi:DUF3108 domain-containing protein [Luteimonas sp. RD2P54]|uniref:DUF3108 domain-containing protein n=1 Tax=Luteimonas endophytica TaxID=3042023 RepID=A0ABT6JB02_9GAMM|nr:DUF3108 domain-containing protein [Luteimonas endophytica]MDH5824007.1 DUF3108 domain-containing protein [Luteimonas endophytica]